MCCSGKGKAMRREVKLLDAVALLEDVQVDGVGLQRGEVGAVVEVLAPGVYEVEFCDDQGRAYAFASLHAEDRLPSPCHRHEPLLQGFCIGNGQAQHRLEYMRFMAPNSVGRIQTIIPQFFDGDNGAFTVWESPACFVFKNSAVSSH